MFFSNVMQKGKERERVYSLGLVSVILAQSHVKKKKKNVQIDSLKNDPHSFESHSLESSHFKEKAEERCCHSKIRVVRRYKAFKHLDRELRREFAMCLFRKRSLRFKGPGCSLKTLSPCLSILLVRLTYCNLLPLVQLFLKRLINRNYRERRQEKAGEKRDINFFF